MDFNYKITRINKIEDANIKAAIVKGPKKGKIKSKIKVSHKGNEDLVESIDATDLIINITKNLKEDLKEVIGKAFDINPNKIKLKSAGKYVSDSADEEFYEIEMDLDPESTKDSIEAPIKKFKDNNYVILNSIKDSFETSGSEIKLAQGEEVLKSVSKNIEDTLIKLIITKKQLGLNTYSFYIMVTTPFTELVEFLKSVTPEEYKYVDPREFETKLKTVKNLDVLTNDNQTVVAKLMLSGDKASVNNSLVIAKRIFDSLYTFIENVFYAHKNEPEMNQQNRVQGGTSRQDAGNVLFDLIFNRSTDVVFDEYGKHEVTNNKEEINEFNRLYENSDADPNAFEEMCNLVLAAVNKAEQQAIEKYERNGMEYTSKDAKYFNAVRSIVKSTENAAKNPNGGGAGIRLSASQLADKLYQGILNYYQSTIGEKTITGIQNTAYHKPVEYKQQSDLDYIFNKNNGN